MFNAQHFMLMIRWFISNVAFPSDHPRVFPTINTPKQSVPGYRCNDSTMCGMYIRDSTCSHFIAETLFILIILRSGQTFRP